MGRITQTMRRLVLWTIACLLIFASAMLLVARNGTWNILVHDRSAGVIVSDIGGIELQASGASQQTGAFHRDTFPGRRETLQIFVRPSAPEQPSSRNRQLIVSMETLSCVDGDTGKTWGDMSAATFADWMRSLNADVSENVILREADLLSSVASDVAQDPQLGVSFDRSLFILVSRHHRRTHSFLRGHPFYVSRTPTFFSTALAVVSSAGIWLTGILLIALRSLRSAVSEQGATHRRWQHFLIPGLFAGLWTAVCGLGRDVLANWLPTALSQEFPAQFLPGASSRVMVADLVLVIGWIIGLLVIVVPPAVLWRLRSRRKSSS